MEEQRFCYGEDCNIYKPASEFLVYRTRVCRECNNKQAQARKKKALEKRLLEAKPRTCSCCEVFKEFSEFPQKNITNICRECHSKKAARTAKKGPSAKERQEQLTARCTGLERENRELRDQLERLSLRDEVREARREGGKSDD